MSTDIRWQQRYQNFEKSLQYLEIAINIKEPDIIQKAGLIQFFEISFELAWKTLKDFLEERGVLVKFPRDTVKEAFKYELIDNGDLWMDMLEKRNLMAHTYNDTNAELAFRLIVENYYEALQQVYLKLGTEL